MASVETLRRLYVDERKSIPDIEGLTSEPRSRIRRLLIQGGVQLRTRAEGIAAARHKLGVHLRGKQRTFTESWKANIRKAALRRWDGVAVGTTVKPSGYIEYTTGPHKGRSVHVVLMEQRLNRHLMNDEIVHHIDGNRSNNDINNLALMTRSAHTRLHRREQKMEQKNG